MKIYWLTILLISGCSNATFTDSYIEQNKGTHNVEIPEVQELVHIAIALTPTGIQDSNMVNHSTEYYQSVMEYFRPFINDPLIEKLDKKLAKRYHHIKMDACGYFFNSQNKIVKSKNYRQLNWTPLNYIDPLLDDLMAFSNKSNFREFFNSHREYYSDQEKLLEKQSPIKKQWRWLEERFPQRYDHYWITFSPLVGGNHSTNKFIVGDFKQTVMFVQSGHSSDRYSEKVKEGLMTRVVFTEIDHNYVNPTSEKFKKEIKTIFKNRDNWTTAGSWADYYQSELAVFNEYMTWSIFSLYAYDNFEEDDFQIINKKVESQMDDYRGFSKFSTFNSKMLSLYQIHQPTQVEDLYPLILKWCKNEIINKGV